MACSRLQYTKMKSKNVGALSCQCYGFLSTTTAAYSNCYWHQNELSIIEVSFKDAHSKRERLR